MERAHIFETVIVIALIVLVGILCMAVVSPTSPTVTGWEMQGNGSVDYMFSGSDDTLYVFQGNNVTAINSNGHVAWNYLIPDGMSHNIYSSYTVSSAVDEAGGTLYLALTGPTYDKQDVADNAHGVKYVARVASKLIAISPNGVILWEHPFTAGEYAFDDYGYVNGYLLPWHIDARSYGGRIFMSHDHQDDVLDSNGKLLFTIENITAPVAVDENGRIYAARTASVDAYDLDGKLLWSRALGENITGTYYEYTYYPPAFRSLPLYANGTLYVPVDNGTAALGTDGSIKWIRHLTRGSYVPFSALPIDNRGYSYLMIPNQPGGYTYISSISPQGVVDENAWEYGTNTGTWPVARNDGTIYFVTNNASISPAVFNNTIDAGSINTVTAFDMSEKRQLWNFSATGEDMHEVTVNASNWNTFRPEYWEYYFRMNDAPGKFNGQPVGSIELLPMQEHQITINPGKNVVYISYYSVIYEAPIVFNRSRAIYVNSLYALDNNGTLLWKQPMEGYVTHTVARNDTFYYNTDSGKIGGIKMNIAAGVALAALAYVFLRFFMLGTISRARTRLDQNENRNIVLRYIVDNPGVTATEVARDLKMNMGTVRYHLFILTMNHKVIVYRADNKYQRYFTNAGTYTREEQSMLALLRRGPLRETLHAITEKPGISIHELAERLNVSTTAAHRDLTVLTHRGIIAQIPGDERRYGYIIRDEQQKHVEKAMRILRPK